MLAVLLIPALVSLHAVAAPQPVPQGPRGAFVSRDEPVTSSITSDPGAYSIQTDPPYPSSSSTTGDSNSQGVDNVPTVCFYGCYKAFDFFEGNYVGSPGNTCYTQNTTEACTPVCTGANYTALVTCLECIVANGEEDTTVASATSTLDWINGVCEGAGVEGFEPSTTLTATPTTTGPFTWPVTGTVLPSAWTGFTSYLAELTSSTDEMATVSSVASPSIVTFNMTATSSVSSSASSLASASASSGAAHNNAFSPVLLGPGLVLLGALLA